MESFKEITIAEKMYVLESKKHIGLVVTLLLLNLDDCEGLLIQCVEELFHCPSCVNDIFHNKHILATKTLQILKRWILQLIAMRSCCGIFSAC